MKIKATIGLIVTLSVLGTLFFVQAVSSSEPDRLMVMDPPYLPDQSLSDDYRCFLLDPELEEDAFATAYQILPDQKALVRRVVLFVIGPDAIAEAEVMDQAEAGSGWTCSGGPGVREVGGLDQALGSWIPGLSNTTFPEGTGKFIKAGSQLIIQVHYDLRGIDSVVPDASQVQLFLEDGDSNLIPFQRSTIATSLEIRYSDPYPKDSNHPCRRGHAPKRCAPLPLRHAP